MEDKKNNEEEKFDEWCKNIPVLDDESPGAVKFCEKYYTEDYFMPQASKSYLKDYDLTRHDDLLIRSLIFIQDLNRDNDIDRSGFSTTIAKSPIQEEHVEIDHKIM